MVFLFSAALASSDLGTPKSSVWKWDAGMFLGTFPFLREVLGFLLFFIGLESNGSSLIYLVA